MCIKSDIVHADTNIYPGYNIGSNSDIKIEIE